MVGLFQENGPCEVVELARGKLGTQAREWGWDRSSNILYIDQPNKVGFSYDTATNGSIDLLTSTISTSSSSASQNQPGGIFLNGTFSTTDSNSTSNTTQIAAHALWHMLQGFLGMFPQYNPGTNFNSTSPGAVGINLFTESYGGKYGPAFAAHFENQNKRRLDGSLPLNQTLEIRLSSVGIMQGCVDDLVQGRFYPIFANNNTYSIQAMSLVQQQNAANSFLSAGGCRELVQSCRERVLSMDLDSEGNVATVNEACSNAQESCETNVKAPYMQSGRSVYDITQKLPDPFPPSTYLEYLNSAEVQAAVGAAVNYTQASSAVASAFNQTGDYERGGQISDISYLLSLGIRVALIYGDRDYICNWLGGEAISFSIAAQSSTYAPFYSAGYADIVVNGTYVGGASRQYGNLSFSRIYDAGHLIAAYQPETAFTVFTRIIMGTDISLGGPIDLGSFASSGDANATHANTAPDQAKPTCYVRSAQSSCNGDQIDKLKSGQGVIINGVLYDDESEWKAPASSLSDEAGYPGSIPVSMTDPPASSTIQGGSATRTSEILTGVYSATATPSVTQKRALAGKLNHPSLLQLLKYFLVASLSCRYW